MRCCARVDPSASTSAQPSPVPHPFGHKMPHADSAAAAGAFCARPCKWAVVTRFRKGWHSGDIPYQRAARRSWLAERHPSLDDTPAAKGARSVSWDCCGRTGNPDLLRSAYCFN